MVINPATPVAVLEEILQDVDQVLGDDGQTRVLDISNFLPTTLPKIRRVREMIEQLNSGFDLEVDGGIDAETGPLAAAAGANVLVSGTAVFGENELVSTAMDRLRASIKQWQKTASGGQVRRSSTGPPWGR